GGARRAADRRQDDGGGGDDGPRRAAPHRRTAAGLRIDRRRLGRDRRPRAADAGRAAGRSAELMTEAREPARARAGGAWLWRVGSALPLLIGAVAIWRVLGPAIMSYDSMQQYEQAMTGRYNDWHPPLLALLLRLALRLGGGIATLMLLQTMAGLLAVQ